MGLKKYGVLRGRVLAAQREDDRDSPHYQVQVAAAGTNYRLAVNVMSQLSPSELLFIVLEDFQHPVTQKLPALAEGFTVLPKQPDTVALDFIRGNLFNPCVAMISARAEFCFSYFSGHDPAADGRIDRGNLSAGPQVRKRYQSSCGRTPLRYRPGAWCRGELLLCGHER